MCGRCAVDVRSAGFVAWLDYAEDGCRSIYTPAATDSKDGRTELIRTLELFACNMVDLENFKLWVELQRCRCKSLAVVRLLILIARSFLY